MKRLSLTQQEQDWSRAKSLPRTQTFEEWLSRLLPEWSKETKEKLSLLRIFFLKDEIGKTSLFLPPLVECPEMPLFCRFPKSDKKQMRLYVAAMDSYEEITNLLLKERTDRFETLGDYLSWRESAINAIQEASRECDLVRQSQQPGFFGGCE